MQNRTDLATVPTSPNIPATNDAVGGALARFAFDPGSFTEQMQLAELLAGSDIIPKDLRGKKGNIFIILDMAARLGVPWGFMIVNTYVVNGRPAMFGDLPLAIVRHSRKLGAIKEWYEGEPYAADVRQKTLSNVNDEYMAVCEVQRAGEPQPVRSTFSVADARQAKLWGKEGPWQQYWPRMMKFRARGYALRDVFGDVLQGLAIGEEVEDALRNVTPVQAVPPPAGATRSDNVLNQLRTLKPAMTIDQEPEAKTETPPPLFDERIDTPPAPTEANQAQKPADEETPPNGGTPPAAETKPPAEEVTVTMLTELGRKKGLDEDGFRMLVHNATGQSKLTKAGLPKVLDALNELPIQPISEKQIEGFRGMVSLPDARMLAYTAQQAFMTGQELAALIKEMTGSDTLTTAEFKRVLAEVEQRVREIAG